MAEKYSDREIDRSQADLDTSAIAGAQADATEKPVRVSVWIAIAALVTLLDQGSKWVIVKYFQFGEERVVWPYFSWVRWHNTGAAFSFLNDAGGWQKWFFVVLACGFSIYLVWEITRLRASEKAQALVFALILGGAVGNLLDRLQHGYVVDFILWHYQERIFPAFNLADSAIFLGAVLWFWLLWREHAAQKAIAEGR